MAKSVVKGGKIREMKRRNGAATAPEPPQPEPQAQPETPFDEPAPQQATQEPVAPPPKRGRPKERVTTAGAARPILQIIREVPRENWAAGIANVKVYRLAPLINRNNTSEHRYITEFTEPCDEQRLLRECGSGDYRLYLTYMNQAGGGMREMARGEVRVLNEAFPPKIPAGEWLDDPRNKIWAWAKPKEQPQQSSATVGAETVLDAIRLGNELRKEAVDELKAATPAPVQQQTVAAADPVRVGLEMAKELLQMKADNPMVDVLRDELKSLRDEMREERAENRRLQNELFAAKTAPAAAAAPQKSIKDSIIEAKELLEVVGIRIGGDGAAAAPVSPRINGTMQFWKDLIGEVVNSPAISQVVGLVANRMMAGAPGTPPPNGMINPAQQNGAGQPPAAPEVELIQWAQKTLIEPLIQFINDNATGDVFAATIYDMYPKRLPALQKMRHPQLQGEGAPVLLEMLKHDGVWKSDLFYREAQVKSFLDAFCGWRDYDGAPEDGPQPVQQAGPMQPPPDRSSAAPIDLDSEEAGQGSEDRP